MLEGLEIIICEKQEILDDNEEFRLDSEYYRKEYIDLNKYFKNVSMLKDIVTMSDLSTNGSFATVKAIMDNNDEKTIPFIRSGNCGNTFIELNDLEYISEKSHLQLPKSTTKLHDIMMARKGKIGGATIITENEVNFNCNENVIKLSIKDSSNFNPFYFTVFFNSKFGLKQIERLSTGNVQPWVSIFQIKKLQIPQLDFSFQKEIEKIVFKSCYLRKTSKNLYAQAEELLLAEIGLNDFNPSKEPVNIKNFSESFATSGRLDAEYYQPKYDDYLHLIVNYKKGYEIIDKSCNVKLRNFNPVADTEYKYIELSNVGKAGDINGCTFDLGKELPSRARRKVNVGDVIISSIEGSLSSCALVTSNYDNGLCSTGFYVINSDKINSQTLLVLFKSEVMQNILKQNCSGTILTAINKDEFLNIPIPIIDDSKQQQIAELIEESFALKKQSEQLLEVAKRAVEVAIEESEDVAMGYIDEEIAVNE